MRRLVLIVLSSIWTMFTVASSPVSGSGALQASDDAKTIDFLQRITLAHGTPGVEDNIRSIIRDRMKSVASLTEDPKGALVAKLQGSSAGPVILLAAHMDEVGFQVKAITPGGFLKVVPLGTWFPSSHRQPASRRKDRSGGVDGVFGATPPHLMSREDTQQPVRLSDLFVDVGAENAEQVRKLGVQLAARGENGFA